MHQRKVLRGENISQVEEVKEEQVDTSLIDKSNSSKAENYEKIEEVKELPAQAIAIVLLGSFQILKLTNCKCIL